MRVNLCLCHLSAWNIYHSLAPGSLSPSSMIKAQHPVLTPSCAATAETRVRTSERAGKDIIKNLPCDSKPVSGAFPFSRRKHSSGNHESIWPGDCKYIIPESVRKLFFMNFYMCGLHVLFACCGFYADFCVFVFWDWTKATYFWCTYVQKHMNRCVCVCVNDGEASGFFYAMKSVCSTFLSVEVWVWV